MSNMAKRLSRLERVPLISAPTPLEHWGKLSRHLGVDLYSKRDDLSGIGVGGNKLRKLEYIAGSALKSGATHFITTGGPQSNHARLTAAVAARLGLRCTLLLKGRWDGLFIGNLMLDSLFGANIRIIDAVDYQQIYRAMGEEAKKLSANGEKPIVIPLGGATPEGTAGYVAGFAEITSQLMQFQITPDWIVVADGTGSTHAGLAVGTKVFSSRSKVLGISVSWRREVLEAEIRRLMAETAGLLGAEVGLSEPLCINDDYVGPGYAKISEDGLAAIKLLAREEGIVLDSTYTGKAFAGLVGLVAKSEIAQGSCVVFVHTGGLPELYTRNISELELG
jgi:L-cysteate sulfo-lyase